MNPILTERIEEFEVVAKEYFAHRRAEAKDVALLIDSIEYSFFNGGKRFRPMLCFAVADAYGVAPKDIISFALAIECIHTYSLIHDDLPCMDDDNERRGQPTNHIKFSEDTALLAGDSLLTEAFRVLSFDVSPHSLELVKLLSEASGLNGMVRGQVLDLGKGEPIESLGQLIKLHELKTGCLISMAFEGPAVVANKYTPALKDLGKKVGLAFQIKDDLLDEDENEELSFISFLGKKGTQDYLSSLSERIEGDLTSLEINTPLIPELVSFNISRQK